MAGSGLGAGLEDAGPAGAELGGSESDGVEPGGWAALPLGRGVGTLGRLDELAVGLPGRPAEDEVAGGG